MSDVKYTVSSHYNGEIKIKFYPGKHGFQLEGHRDYLLGVTSCTGVVDKSVPLLIWAGRLTRDFILDQIKKGNPVTELMLEEAIRQHQVKKEQAADIGHMVHAWAEDYIAGKNPVVPEDINVRNGVLGFLKLVKEHKPRFLFSEKVVYSREHNFVGIADGAMTLESEDHKVRHLIDWKTSKSVYMEMYMQVAAYEAALKEEFGYEEWGDKFIFRLDKESGEFESHRIPQADHDRYFAGFLSCLKLRKMVKQWDIDHPWRK